MDKELRNQLVNSMKELVKEGFKCFILKENPNYIFGYITTPSDNIIYIQPAESGSKCGWTTSLQYKPSHKTGTGCRCEDEPFQDITASQILHSEMLGLNYATRLGAEFYKSSKEFWDKKWNKLDFEEVTL